MTISLTLLWRFNKVSWNFWKTTCFFTLRWNSGLFISLVISTEAAGHVLWKRHRRRYWFKGLLTVAVVCCWDARRGLKNFNRRKDFPMKPEQKRKNFFSSDSTYAFPSKLQKQIERGESRLSSYLAEFSRDITIFRIIEWAHFAVVEMKRCEA